jgi:hypothetical protein
LIDRWAKYQSEKASKALVLGTPAQTSSGLAVSRTPTVDPDEPIAVEMAELIEALAVIEESTSYDPSELEQEIQEEYNIGRKEGFLIGSARIKGRADSIAQVKEKAKEMARQKRAESQD